MVTTVKEPQTSPCLTLKEAAQLMGSTVHYVRTLVWSGQVSFQRHGKRFVVPKSEILELIDRGWRRNGVAA